MVAVEVRYEYVVYEREVYVVLAQLYLRSLTTVNHKLLVANLHYLRTGIVTCGGQRRTTP